MFHIIRNHAFVDGNKRTANGCMRYFLLKNGVDFLFPPAAERFELARRIAQKEINESEIADCLRRRAV